MALDTLIRRGESLFCCRECYMKYRKNHSESAERQREKNILYQKKNKYGLTEDQYKKLFMDQNNRCAICGCVFPSSSKGFVDHDHITGMVRGLLCSKCNSILGFAKDDIRILERAIEYLNSHK